MGIARVQKTQAYAPRRRLDGRRESRIPTLDEARLFWAGVRAAGKVVPILHVLKDYEAHGLNMALIARVEKIFEGHRDLLVDFNKFVPEEFQCTVPVDEEN